MKYCIEKYPMGSFPRQQTPGRFMDDYLYENIKILAKNIVNDLTYLGVCFSSSYEVGAGKSNFMQQIGEAYTELINKMHGINLEFTKRNIVMSPRDLPHRALELPQYSFIICDEWEDAHYWSELAKSLRQYFRKCRQLNQFIVIIIPNFFQLPMSYAVSRSIFAIDVRFEEEFERGHFRFYNFERKKNLYIKGRKIMDYNVVKSNFFGRFTKGYAINDAEYRQMKYDDMIRSEQQEKQNKEDMFTQFKLETINRFQQKCPHIHKKDLAAGFGVGPRTIQRWIHDYEKEIPKKKGF